MDKKITRQKHQITAFYVNGCLVHKCKRCGLSGFIRTKDKRSEVELSNDCDEQLVRNIMES